MNPPPSWPGLIGDWSFEPGVLGALGAVAVAYWWGARAQARPSQARPSQSCPSRGAQAAFWAGVALLAVALLSPVATYAHELLAVHMVQHLLLALVAAPLLVVAHPLDTLLARLPPSWRAGALRAARSRPARTLSRPVVAWVLFAATGWAVHFSPLFDLSLRQPAVHAAEHAAFIVTGLVFWAPIAGRALVPGLKVLSVAVAMPQNTFLALAILSARSPLYETYVRAASGRTWGPSALADQRQAAGLMWVAGDLALLVAVLVVTAAWSRTGRE